MNKFWSLAAAALTVLGVSSAQASNFHVGLSLLKYDEKVTTDSSESKSEKLHTDIKLGYVADNGLYMGVMQSGFSESNSTSSPNRSALGATLGYRSADGWLFDATYFLSSTFDNGTKFTEGSGYAVEFGYNFKMSSNFYMGVELAMKSLTYKKANNVATNITFTEMMPLFNLGFYF